MIVLVINTGSSSIKYQLFNMETETVLAKGLVEKIGEEVGALRHDAMENGGEERTLAKEVPIKDHHQGLSFIVDLLSHSEHGVIRDKREIDAVGHRVVHGGEAFHRTTIIDARVIQAIEDNIPLAPLHNPTNLLGIEVSREVFPHCPQVAVFDTAFNQTIAKPAYLYAVPYELYEKHGVRKYGFHGTSHAYVSEAAAEFLQTDIGQLNIITIHLGNGASMAAIKGGKCIDTSMGMTPLGGLVMGSRCGDLDPAMPFFLAANLDMSLDQIDSMLNRDSGLKGLCGSNDMRAVVEMAGQGDEKASTALEVYCLRIKKYIGSYLAALGSLDCIVFTAGVGENSPYIREKSCAGLEKLGIEIDASANNSPANEARAISSAASAVKVLVVPTNEELKIARETVGVLVVVNSC
jgi:acetate kinase